MEKPACLFYIARNLLAKSVDGREFDFIPQSLQKTNLHLCLWSQLNGMKIQQMRLDGKQVRSKCRPVAHVGHRIEPLRADSSPRNVNAKSWNQFVVAREVDGRDRVL